jgi:hypothetical protein
MGWIVHHTAPIVYMLAGWILRMYEEVIWKHVDAIDYRNNLLCNMQLILSDMLVIFSESSTRSGAWHVRDKCGMGCNITLENTGFHL